MTHQEGINIVQIESRLASTRPRYEQKWSTRIVRGLIVDGSSRQISSYADYRRQADEVNVESRRAVRGRRHLGRASLRHGRRRAGAEDAGRSVGHGR